MSTFRLNSIRSMVAILMTGVTLAACGGDDPEPFNPTGMSEDMAALGAPFESQAATSFAYYGQAMDDAFVAPIVSGSMNVIRSATEKRGFFNSAASVRATIASLTRRPATNVALAVIPAEYLGQTYTYDPVDERYELSDLTGAPANGVRFILYAINPVTREPVDPLQEVGYADLLDQSTGSSNSVRVQLVSNNVTYFDYGVTGSSTASSAQVVVDGYVTDGTTRVNFDLNTSAVQTGSEAGAITFDYDLSIPNRDVQLDYLVVIASSAGGGSIEVDLSVNGANGSVGIEGQLNEGPGVLNVSVNGDDFARINMTADQVTSITNPEGGELTAQETGALIAVWAAVLRGLDVFEDLLDPLDNLL